MSIENTCKIGVGSTITNEPCDAGSSGGSGTVTQIDQGPNITLTPNPITTTGTITANVPTDKINYHAYNGSAVAPVITVASPTTFDISNGELFFYEYSGLSGGGSPVETQLSFPGASGVPGTLFGGGNVNVTYISIDKTGTIIQRSREANAIEVINGECIIGNIDHQSPGLTTFTTPPTNTQHAAFGLAETLRQFVRSRGGISLTGNTISDVAGTLSIQNTDGIGLRFGANHGVTNNPDLVPSSAQNPLNILRVYEDVTNNLIVTPSTTLDNQNYNNAGVLTSMPNNDFQIMRVFYAYGSDACFVYYGNDTYNTLNAAVGSINTEDFNEHPDTMVGAPIAIIIAGEDSTDTSDTSQFRFIKLGGIRSTADFGAATATVSLQTAYENGAQINMNNIQGPVRITQDPTPTFPMFFVEKSAGNALFTCGPTINTFEGPNWIQSDSADSLTIFPWTTGAGNTGEIRFRELTANGTEHVGFKAPDAIGANVMWTLPNVVGNDGEVLTRTGGAGALIWAPAPTSAFAARGFAYDNTGPLQTFNNTVATVINYTVNIYNDNSDYDGTNTYTCPTNGLYHFEASISFFSNPAGVSHSMYFLINGVAQRGHAGSTPQVGPIIMNCSLTQRFAINDTIQVVIIQNSGANQTGTQSTRNSFSGYRIDTN